MDDTLDVAQVRKDLEAAGRGEGLLWDHEAKTVSIDAAVEDVVFQVGVESGQRTGEWGKRHEIALEQLVDRKGQLTGIFAGLTRHLHRDLVSRTDDGRDYRVVVEVRTIVLVHPCQAQIGEYICFLALEKYLGKIFDTNTTQASGLFLVGNGGDHYRYFERDSRGFWCRVDVPQGYVRGTDE